MIIPLQIWIEILYYTSNNSKKVYKTCRTEIVKLNLGTYDTGWPNQMPQQHVNF
jgi:hypothetical protein